MQISNEWAKDQIIHQRWYGKCLCWWCKEEEHFELSKMRLQLLSLCVTFFKFAIHQIETHKICVNLDMCLCLLHYFRLFYVFHGLSGPYYFGQYSNTANMSLRRRRCDHGKIYLIYWEVCIVFLCVLMGCVIWNGAARGHFILTYRNHC